MPCFFVFFLSVVVVVLTKTKSRPVIESLAGNKQLSKGFEVAFHKGWFFCFVSSVFPLLPLTAVVVFSDGCCVQRFHARTSAHWSIKETLFGKTSHVITIFTALGEGIFKK